ncbi:putative membrane bound protein [Phage f2b1]|nr:putative membrane bound protein [Phage f2b1]
MKYLMDKLELSETQILATTIFTLFSIGLIVFICKALGWYLIAKNF